MTMSEKSVIFKISKYALFLFQVKTNKESTNLQYFEIFLYNLTSRYFWTELLIIILSEDGTKSTEDIICAGMF